jgi:hypothetical protein
MLILTAVPRTNETIFSRNAPSRFKGSKQFLFNVPSEMQKLMQPRNYFVKQFRNSTVTSRYVVAKVPVVKKRLSRPAEDFKIHKYIATMFWFKDEVFFKKFIGFLGNQDQNLKMIIMNSILEPRCH